MQQSVGVLYNIYNVVERHLKAEVEWLHLGRIADSMFEWEGLIAEHLSLRAAEVAEIKMKYPRNLKLQT